MYSGGQFLYWYFKQIRINVVSIVGYKNISLIDYLIKYNAFNS